MESTLDLEQLKLSQVSQIEVILTKFIKHHQLFEFIELFQAYMREEMKMNKSMKCDQLPVNPMNGKSFLHLAVEHQSDQILAYLLID